MEFRVCNFQIRFGGAGGTSKTVEGKERRAVERDVVQ